MFTLAQWIARLTKGYIKYTGKKPDGLAHLKIKMEAAQRVRDQSKVVKGKFNPKEEWWKSKEKAVKKRDRPSIRLMKNFEKDLTDIDLAKEGYNLQEIGILQRARNVMKKEGQNPDDALSWIRSEMADDAGIEFEEFMPDFDWGDFPGKAEGGRIGYAVGKIVKGGRWFINSLKKNLTDMEAGHPRFKVIPAKDQETLKAGYRTFIKDLEAGEEIPIEALEAISKNPQYYKTKKVTRSQDPDLAEVEELIDEKVFGHVRQELKDLETVGRKPNQSGGLAYMLGEPTYMKYDGGGSVGHAPWHKPSGQPQPQGQDQTPTPNVATRPDPMKAPRGLPSLAPRTMDPQYMQQQMMQKAMMGQGQGQMGQPRMGMAEGKKAKKKALPEELPPYQGPEYETDDAKEIGKEILRRYLGSGVMGVPIGGGFQSGIGYGKDRPFDYGIGYGEGDSGLYAGYGIRDEGENVYTGGYKGDNWDLGVRKEEGGDPYFTFKKKLKKKPKYIFEKASGGRIGFGLGGINKARRAFLKMLAGLTGAGVAAGTGLLKLGKVAPKVIPKVTETITRGADGMPTYIYDLIEVVKAKGIKKIMDSNINKYPDTVHSYKGVDVTEDAAGNIKIKSDKTGVATDQSTGKTHEGIAQENHIQIEKGQMNVKDEGLETQKGFQEPDEYIEGTVYPDMDGKMKDFEEGLDEAIHLDFKKIADETLEEKHFIKRFTPKKASGGLAHMLGE